MTLAERFWQLSREDQEELLRLTGMAVATAAERSADTWWVLGKIDELLASKSDAAPDAYAEAAW